MSNQDEAQLWSTLLELRAQVDAILRRAHRGFTRVLGPGALDDCRQEVTLILWERRGILGSLPEHRRRAYVEALVLRAALRFFARAARVQERTAPLEDAATPERTPRAPEAGEHTSALEAIGFAGWVGSPELLQALKAVPPRAYEILDLHYREGLPFAVIAARLDSNGAAVRKRHNRAIETLRKCLRGGGEDR